MGLRQVGGECFLRGERFKRRYGSDGAQYWCWPQDGGAGKSIHNQLPLMILVFFFYGRIKYTVCIGLVRIELLVIVTVVGNSNKKALVLI